MIYDDAFIELLEERLAPVNVKSDNIVCRCPFCEMAEDKKHYHLWISTESPVFRCWHSDCGARGHISKLLYHLQGSDTSKKYINEESINNQVQPKYSAPLRQKEKKIILPELDTKRFNLKDLYVKKRIGILETNSIKGLVYDINKLIVDNNIKLTEKDYKLLPYLHSNFIGFLSERNSCLVLRNIGKSSFRHYKIILSPSTSPFIDYYKIGKNNKSKDIVLAEGIFDIFSAVRNWKPDFNPRLFAAGFSADCYESLIYSVCFDEQVFRVNVHILSDQDVSLWFYKRIKSNLKHLINSLSVYYNKLGHDFGSRPLLVEKLM
jgi:hypothetical protein